MLNENINTYLQCIYLGISLISSGCVLTHFHTINCSNMVGIMCLGDLFFVKKKDMLLHHILVLSMLEYMNINDNNTYINQLVSTILRTEISTVFLITNNLLNSVGIISDMIVFKNINQFFFVTTFFYYRVYNYSYLILDKNIYNSLSIYSRNDFEFYKMYGSICSFYILNLYWFIIICYRIRVKVHNLAIKQKIKQNMKYSFQ